MEPVDTDFLGLIVYAAFLVAAVALGPLEAALGLAAYWLFGPERDRGEPTASSEA